MAAMEPVTVKEEEEEQVIVIKDTDDDGLVGCGGGTGVPISVTFKEEARKTEPDHDDQQLIDDESGAGDGAVTFESADENKAAALDDLDGASGGGDGDGGGDEDGDGAVTFESADENKAALDDLDGASGGGGGGGDDEMQIKEEKVELMGEDYDYKDYKDRGGGGGGGGGCCNCGGSSSESSSTLPKPIEGLHEPGPPPFLTKTYDMVEDPCTDRILSWNGSRDSFIVWDAVEFSTNLLPRYFKHSNFSSFIRQLNTYGFRKVDHDRWEFANEEFRRGKKHLLKNIKRRRQGFAPNNQQKEANTCAEMAKTELESQFESLKKEQSVLEIEVLKLRQQQENSDNHIAAFEKRIQCAAHCHQQLVLFFARTVGSPKFVQKMVDNKRQRKEVGFGEMAKRRRLEAINTSLSLNFLSQATAQTKFMKGLQKAAAGPSDMMERLLNDSMNDHYQPCSSVSDHGINLNSETSDPNSPDPMWEKMTEELLGENEAEVVLDGGNTSKYLHELENLIEKPTEWGEYVKLLEDDFLGSGL